MQKRLIKCRFTTTRWESVIITKYNNHKQDSAASVFHQTKTSCNNDAIARTNSLINERSVRASRRSSGNELLNPRKETHRRSMTGLKRVIRDVETSLTERRNLELWSVQARVQRLVGLFLSDSSAFLTSSKFNDPCFTRARNLRKQNLQRTKLYNIKPPTFCWKMRKLSESCTYVWLKYLFSYRVFRLMTLSRRDIWNDNCVQEIYLLCVRTIIKNRAIFLF